MKQVLYLLYKINKSVSLWLALYFFNFNKEYNNESTRRTTKTISKKHAFTIEGVEFFIHRARTRDLDKLHNPITTITVCTCDENGDPIFSTEDIEGRINLNALDSQIINQIIDAIMKLYATEDPVDHIEKK
ncbi:hypothetical protein RBH51_09310 [Escherichia coli]|uniref:hypothetical protein n=1 Tax=Escherichia coli TaxID=562 RepID=UPI002FC7FE84